MIKFFKNLTHNPKGFGFSLMSLFFFGAIFSCGPLKAEDDPSKSFLRCQKIFLGGKTLEDYQNKENSEEFSKLLESLKKEQSCSRLLRLASLRDNGLLKNRNLLAQAILKSFVEFHHNWLMPEDLDEAPRCEDKFQKDIHDELVPAYHLTRTLFQPSRKASLAVTSYSDLRSLREGDNPEISLNSNMSSKEIASHLQVDEKEFNLTGREDLVGFLYRRSVTTKALNLPSRNEQTKNWYETRGQKGINIYEHLGGGFLGNPSFLYRYSPVLSSELYQADGRQRLPRKLAKAILEKVLCQDLSQLKASSSLYVQSPLPQFEDNQSPTNSLWNHPVTQEKNCLHCHQPLDNLAAGLRTLTFIPTRDSCSSDKPRAFIPMQFNASYSQSFWQKAPPSNQPFHGSYAVGHLGKERFVGFNQLGRTIANDPRFFECHVKKYFSLIQERDPNLQELKELTEKYREHQDGLKLFDDILAIEGGRS